MATVSPTGLGPVLRRLRVVAGLSQEELATRAGLSARGVSDLERGVRTSPHPETVRLLAEALALTPDERALLIAAAHPELTAAQTTTVAARGPAVTQRRSSLNSGPLTRLVGRDAEIIELCALLQREDVRLVTLTGPGGVGKTQLVLDVAAKSVADFADGGWFVPLAPVSDSAFVVSAIWRSMELSGAVEDATPARLASFIGDQHALLVLDNFEQVLEAGPLVVDLLRSCPRLKVLVTSRARLQVSGEHEYPVPPLSLLSRGGLLGSSDAVRLFIARAKAVKPEFELTPDNATAVTEICHRVDGLPLAIELAAARVKILPPQALAARLERRLALLTGGGRDLPARQQTMRAAISWSYDLLTSAEQALFRSLAVFVSGIPLDYVENGLRSHPSPLDALASLVDKSLLQVEESSGGEPRYLMLETIREYGLEQLAARGEEAETRDRHARYMLALAEAAESLSWTSHHRRWRELLDTNYGNVRAALDWFEQTGATEEGLRLAGALALYWHGHSSPNEGRQWLEHALARNTGPPTPARVKGLYAAGLLARRQGDLAGAAAWAREGRARAREIDDRWGAAATEWLLGHLSLADGDLTAARAHFETSLAVFVGVGDAVYTGAALTSLGIEAVIAGDYTRAVAKLEEAAARWREIGSAPGLAWVFFNLARAEQGRGDLQRAAALAHESLVLRAEVDDRAGIADGLIELASIAGVAGRPVRAARLLAAADALCRTQAITFNAEVRPSYDEAQAAVRAQLDEHSIATAWAEGDVLNVAEAIAEAAMVVREVDETASATLRPAGPAGFGLSPREREVLCLLAAGRSNPEIADALFVSRRTVTTHIEHIYAKLGVGSRVEATSHAVRHGLCDCATSPEAHSSPAK